MKTLSLLRGAFCAFAFSALVLAGDVSGTWKAKMETPNGTSEQTYMLKADGEKLTGSVKTARGETEIQDGKVAGDEVSFVVVRKFNDNEFKMSYKGKMEGDDLKLTIDMGERGTREIVAKRSE
ncbi:MAG: hypothetical protein R2762_01945 [Bryobacteraceae bacterium]